MHVKGINGLYYLSASVLICFCYSFSDHSFLIGYHVVREGKVARDRMII